ncbi:MAG: Short chain dehydrogenase/reductase family oxidoreductase [Moraxellaceae bacterium]|jgi:NAD(P)-dependent dehydrogenase (short-subunit alcohol dehydrogenase family)|nr:Short chain dehydrogenase/reductase family oxidoreductase [Moraxellaceae bacterium]
MFGKKISRQASAVVTGAGSGIGRAFALELARRGGRVLCADINLATAQETAAMISASGGQAWALGCDVGVLDQVEAMAAEAERGFGAPVDLVINNAGVGIGGRPIGEISIEDWQWTVNVNMWGVVHGCHVFAPKLRALGRGGIINVCSTASFAAAPLMGPYNLTKAAVLALSETLRAELGGTGIHVTALCPTFVKTNIVQGGRIPTSTSKVAQRLMEWTGRSPESVAVTTLNALDRNQLYVLPQIDARLIWRLKRYAPVSYSRGSGLMARFMAPH